VVEKGFRPIGGGIVLENPDRVLEEVHDRSKASLENPSERDVEEGRGPRTASGIVALISVSVLVCGGIGVLGGVAFEAINPFGLGMVGVVVGICLPVLLRSVASALLRRKFGN
jgi:hypothetical protein